MPSRRDQITMTPQEVEAFLAAARTVVLSTIGPDGVPDTVPMWCVVREGRVWMRTYAKSQKVANLRRDPRVCLLVEAGERYAELRGVQLTGQVRIVEDLEVICGLFADLAIKYEGMDPAHRAGAVAGYRSAAAKMVAMEVEPSNVVSWDHRKLAAEGRP